MPKKNTIPFPPGVSVKDGVLSVPCPECGARMVWKSSKFGGFFGCEAWRETKCSGAIGCHPGTNVPLGIPAPKEVRELRIKAHDAFDKLWRGGKMSRSDAYRWLRDSLSISAEEAHIGQFDAEKCKLLIALVEKELSEERQCFG